MTTPISATSVDHTIRFYPPGVRAIFLLDAIADPGFVPTVVEINAGTDLTPEIVDGGVSGFKTTASTQDAPDLGSLTTRKVAGRTTLDDSSLSMYLSEDGQDARTLFTSGDHKFVVIFPEGTEQVTPAKHMNIHPVTILQKWIDPDTTKVAQFTVDLAASDLPALDKPIPTA